jgi:Ca2+-binding RTX toxin-like protein
MRWSTNKLGTAALMTLGLSLYGCAEGGADWTPAGEDVEGIPELSQPLTPLATPCSYDATSKEATITLAAGGEVAVIAKRSVDSALIVNGVACGTAVASTTKKINITGGAGDDTVIMDYMNGLFAPGSSGVNGEGVNVDLAGGTGDKFSIRGSSSADTISFGSDGIAINSGSTLDIKHANAEVFTVSLGAGNDKFYGTGGNGSGPTAYTGDLTVYGGEGNDTLTGGDGNDTIDGGDGTDTVAGGPGDDVLRGGAGDDTFDEGAATNGSDTFNATGESGSDTVDYSARTVALTITMGTGVDDGEAGENDDVSNVTGVKGGTLGDTITGSANPDIIYGGGGDDTLDGDADADTIYGDDGNDTITGGAGDDTLYGGNGDDTFDEGNATSGADTIYGGAGTDTADYNARTAALTVTLNTTADDGEASEGDNVRSDVENLIGGSGNDTFTGSSSANNLDGRAGDDTLNGGAGNDVFPQGTADDGADTINGGNGTDTVDYSGRTAALTVTMDDTTANDGLTGENDNIGTDVENCLGGSAADSITGNDNDNLLEGGGGGDTLNGGLGNDELFGSGSDDTINGGGGDDTIDGAGGTDTIDCGAGDGDITFTTGSNCEL